MERGGSISAIALASLLVFACSDDDDDGGTRSRPDAGTGRDSGEGSDAQSVGDDASDGGADVDQTAPNGANGFAFDADGMMWLADLFGGQVLRIDPESGRILDRFEQEGAGPDDIAIDEKGRVFWTGWLNGQVGRIDPETRESLIIAELPDGANSVAFSEDGRLFVGLVILNSGLYEIDPEGESEPRLIADEFGSLNAFDFGSDGLLYGPLEDEIVKIDVETGEIVESIIDGPYASVRFGKSDDVVFGLTNGGQDSAGPALHEIDLTNGDMRVLAEPSLAGVDNFAIGPDDRFFVTGFDVPQFVILSPKGTAQTLVRVGRSAADAGADGAAN